MDFLLIFLFIVLLLFIYEGLCLALHIEFHFDKTPLVAWGMGIILVALFAPLASGTWGVRQMIVAIVGLLLGIRWVQKARLIRGKTAVAFASHWQLYVWQWMLLVFSSVPFILVGALGPVSVNDSYAILGIILVIGGYGYPYWRHVEKNSFAYEWSYITVWMGLLLLSSGATYGYLSVITLFVMILLAFSQTPIEARPLSKYAEITKSLFPWFLLP